MKHLIININKEGKTKLYSVLQNVGGGQFVFVEYNTEQKMVKFDRELSTKGNRVENSLFGQVTKTVGVQGQTLVSYANKMRKTNPDFESKPLDNQEYVDANGLATDKLTNVIRYKTTGNESFRVFPNDGGIKTQYFVNGTPATKEQLEIIQRNKAKQGGKPVIMNIGIDKIQKINADGHQIELV